MARGATPRNQLLAQQRGAANLYEESTDVEELFTIECKSSEASKRLCHTKSIYDIATPPRLHLSTVAAFVCCSARLVIAIAAWTRDARWLKWITMGNARLRRYPSNFGLLSIGHGILGPYKDGEKVCHL